jgi:hypothetical protein
MFMQKFHKPVVLMTPSGERAGLTNLIQYDDGIGDKGRAHKPATAFSSSRSEMPWREAIKVSMNSGKKEASTPEQQ